MLVKASSPAELIASPRCEITLTGVFVSITIGLIAYPLALDVWSCDGSIIRDPRHRKNSVLYVRDFPYMGIR
jgi:hypothetical protein